MLVSVLKERWREVGEEMPDRRESSWSDPRVLIAAVGIFLQFVSMCVMVLIVIIGAWIAMSNRGATTEVSNGVLASEVQKVVEKLDEVLDGQKVGEQINIKQQGQIDQNARETDALRGEYKELREQISAMDKSNEQRFNDYSTMIARGLERIEASVKSK